MYKGAKSMLENEFHISGLIAGYLKEQLTKTEQEQLEQWIMASDENRLRFEDLTSEDILNHKLRQYHLADHEAIWKTIKDKLKTAGPDNKNIHVKMPARGLVIAAASVILLVSIGLLFFNNRSGKDFGHSATLGATISPGRNTATLTLSNGRKIVLSGAVKGELSMEDGVAISKTAEGQLIYESKESKDGTAGKTNILSTARGETYQVVLPDNSRVWLNASSILKYPTSFSSEAQRRVELDGEAYFEVSKDRAHPFIVSSKGQDVEVLGTHFNINSYANEPMIKTILLEGSVNVRTRGAGVNNSRLLVPGQQATVSGKTIAIARADVEEAIAWKNGEFLFRNSDLKTAIRQIERWYNVEVVIDASVPENFNLGGVISRSKDISDLLELIESTKDVHFKVEGRRILMTK